MFRSEQKTLVLHRLFAQLRPVNTGGRIAIEALDCSRMYTTSLTTTISPEPRSNAAQDATVSAGDDHFFWSYTEEPHKSRRQAIIKAHPEVSLTNLPFCHNQLIKLRSLSFAGQSLGPSTWCLLLSVCRSSAPFLYEILPLCPRHS